MKYAALMLVTLLALSGCRTTSNDQQIRAQWDNASSYTRSHTYEVTGTEFIKDYRAFQAGKPMELVSIVVTHKTSGSNTVTVEYLREGYWNKIPPTVTYDGFTFVRLMEAPLMFRTGRPDGDIFKITSTRGGTWQVILNFK